MNKIISTFTNLNRKLWLTFALLIAGVTFLLIATEALAFNNNELKIEIFSQTKIHQGTNDGYININNKIGHSQASITFANNELPSYFDARNSEGYGLTTVKNQAPYGACWSFSAVASAEASLIHNKLADKSVNLSEHQLAYFFFNKQNTADPLNLITNDYNSFYMFPEEEPTIEKASSYMDVGGNAASSMWEFASWCGLTNESVAEYNDIADHTSEEAKKPKNPSPGYVAYAMECGPDSEEWKSLENKSWAEMNELYKKQLKAHNLDIEKAFNSDSFHVQNIDQVGFWDIQNNTPNLAGMKQALLEHGALDMAYYEDNKYYIEANNCYYDAEHSVPNHAACIVGWNDNFSKENFTGSDQPEGNGAWLIRNSWGSDENCHSGYFWISYYNKCFQAVYDGNEILSESIAYAYDLESATNYDYNYQYDGSGSASVLAGNEGNPITSVSNIYTAQHDESLEAVSIGIAQENANFTIEIYKNPDATNPKSGSLVSSQTASFKYAGYHTVKLAKTVDLKNGDTFSVVFSVQDSTQANYSYYCEVGNSALRTTKHTAILQYYPDIEQGQCFASYSDNSWIDLYNHNCGLRIKAFTTTSKNIEEAVIGDIPSKSYTSQAYEPKPTVTYKGDTLTEHTDFEYSYQNNTDAGEAILTITGKGKFTGTNSKIFTITQAPLTATYIGASINYEDYTAYIPELRIDGFVGGETEKSATDYESPTIDLPASIEYNHNYSLTPKEGSAKNYEFTNYVTGTLHINEKEIVDINKADIEPISSVTYNAKEQTPILEISYNGTPLIKDTDYTLNYKNNINVGSATVTIDGINDFKGRTFASFNIDKATLTATYKSTSVHYLDYEKYVPIVSVTGFQGKDTEETSAGYSAPYIEKPATIEPGTYTISPKDGKANNYKFDYVSGTLTINKIENNDISDKEHTFIAEIETFEYSATQQTPKPVVTYKEITANGEWTLTEGIHYNVNYSKNKNVGTGILTIEGISPFNGSQSAEFKITPASLTAKYNSVTINIDGYANYEAIVDVTGFLGNDGPSTIKDYESPIVDKPQNVEEGQSYTLKPYGGYAGENYKFDYQQGILQINNNITPQPFPEITNPENYGNANTFDSIQIAKMLILICLSLTGFLIYFAIRLRIKRNS